MRIIDDETIWVPNRHSAMQTVDRDLYENVEGRNNIFKLKYHPEYFIVRTWYGCGDVLYQRPFIKELHEKHGDKLVLKTSWPELFPNIKVTTPGDRLSIQSKNVKESSRYLNLKNRVNMKLGYLTEDLKKMSIVQGIEKNTFKLKSYDMDLKIEDSWMEKALDLKLPENTILLYWPTLRTDWYCPERNPDPKYFQFVVDNLPDRYFVSIGYIREGMERYEIAPRGINKFYDKGELHYTTMIALFKLFPSVVRPAFPLPMVITTQSKSLCLYGGHFSPNVLTDSRMNLNNLKQIAPRPFTSWYSKSKINKTIDLDELKEILSWLI
jgi:hypothetical protein